jgi:hypothetical protein
MKIYIYLFYPVVTGDLKKTPAPTPVLKKKGLHQHWFNKSNNGTG